MVFVVFDIVSGMLCNVFVSVNLFISLYVLRFDVVSCLDVVRSVIVIGRLYFLFFFGRLVGVRLIVIFLVGNLYLLLIIVLCIWLCVFFIVVFGRLIMVNFGNLLLICIFIVIGGVLMLSVV